MMASFSAAISSPFQKKPAQTLDPISTICMLALRTCKAYADYRPAVYDNWFYLEANGIYRSISKVSSNDLQILKSCTIPFFTKCWDNSNQNLVEIVKVAIQGIDQMRAMYEAEGDNSMDTCNILKGQLAAWLPPEPPKEIKPDPVKEQNAALIQEAFGLLQKGRANKKADAPELPIITVLDRLTLALQNVHIAPANAMEEIKLPTAAESALKKQIDIIWSAKEINTFFCILQKKEADTLSASLAHKKIAYLEALKMLERSQ